MEIHCYSRNSPPGNLLSLPEPGFGRRKVSSHYYEGLGGESCWGKKGGDPNEQNMLSADYANQLQQNGCIAAEVLDTLGGE